jgi:hypothetical protein
MRTDAQAVKAAVLKCGKKLLTGIRGAIAFLAGSALRAHPERDRQTGCLAAGLRHVVAAP